MRDLLGFPTPAMLRPHNQAVTSCGCSCSNDMDDQVLFMSKYQHSWKKGEVVGEGGGGGGGLRVFLVFRLSNVRLAVAKIIFELSSYATC